MKIKRNKWIAELAVGMAVVMFLPTLNARDPGLNQPGAFGGTAGVGAPGVGTRDPGFNQRGAVGNTGPARRSVRW